MKSLERRFNKGRKQTLIACLLPDSLSLRIKEDESTLTLTSLLEPDLLALGPHVG